MLIKYTASSLFFSMQIKKNVFPIDRFVSIVWWRDKVHPCGGFYAWSPTEKNKIKYRMFVINHSFICQYKGHLNTKHLKRFLTNIARALKFVHQSLLLLLLRIWIVNETNYGKVVGLNCKFARCWIECPNELESNKIWQCAIAGLSV